MMGKRLRRWLTLGVCGAIASLSLVACSSSSGATYDIGPLFPLDQSKCAKYNGKESGSGITESCIVNKQNCLQAAADWKQAMRNVPDAIEFTCDGQIGTPSALGPEANYSAANSGGSAPETAPPTTSAPSAPADSVLDSVGEGTSTQKLQVLPGDALTTGGKPVVLFVCAEWSAYCAAERWPLFVALSRFGSFTGLGQSESSSSDVFPDTASLTFANSTYTSDSVSFDANEIQDANRQPLKTLSASDQKLFIDVGQGAFPFLAVDGDYTGGAQFDPGVLKGLTQQQITAALSDPSSAVAKAVDGSANVLTAAICRGFTDSPPAACSSSGVSAAKSLLP